MITLFQKSAFWALLCAGFCLFHQPVQAQISIAPTMLFVQDNPGIGEIYLSNSSDLAQEISFEFRFGYPSSSNDGEISMVYDDTLRQQQHDVADYVRIYPSRVIIPPNQSQTVRVQVMPMRDRPDGVYWSRLVVASSAITPDVSAESNEGISTNISYVLEQNIPMFYHKGETTTGISVNDVTVIPPDSTGQLRVLPEIERTGNSPYLGTVYARLFSGDDVLLQERESPAYFYFKDWRGFTFQKPDTQQGPLYLELEFETRRRSLNSRDLVQADNIIHRVELQY